MQPARSPFLVWLGALLVAGLGLGWLALGAGATDPAQGDGAALPASVAARVSTAAWELTPQPATSLQAQPLRDQARLAALLQALAPSWRALAPRPEALDGEGVALDDLDARAQSLLRDSVTRLQPWLPAQSRQLWAGLAQLGPRAGELGGALLLGLAAREPALALSQAAALAAYLPEQAGAVYAPLLEPLWLRQDFARLLQALAAAPLSSALLERLQRQTLARWAAVDADGAARWAQQQPGSPMLLATVQDHWINQDARAATAFASRQQGGLRAALMAESLSRWLALDGPAARDWLQSQPPDPALDASIARHASGDELLRQQPQAAWALAQRISDPALREQTLLALLSHLDEIAPAHSEALAQRLPPDQAAQASRLLAAARGG